MLKKSSASSVIRPQRGCHREDIAFDRLLQVRPKMNSKNKELL
jgi:hypothetical protein